MPHHKALVRRVLEICREHGHPHLPGALSALSVLERFFFTLGPDDVFVLSKGHAAVALYACLEAKGLHPNLSKTHPERDPANGITCTTGSLGHGLPMAAGIALAKHMQGEPGHVHVLMGDGECLEGTTWETLNLVDRWRIQNLVVHIDGNKAGALGDLPCDCTRKLMNLWAGLTWYYDTTKGCGVSFLEGQKDHKRVLTDDEYLRAMEELK